MRKLERGHLHAPCRLVRDHAEARGDLPGGAVAENDALALAPSAIAERKARRRGAVVALAGGLDAVGNGAPVETSSSRSRPVAEPPDSTGGT